MVYFLRSRAHLPPSAPAVVESEKFNRTSTSQFDPQNTTTPVVSSGVGSASKQNVDYGPINIFDANYYNPRAPGSFSGVSSLQRQLKGIKTGSETREWLQSQPTYTLHKPVRKRFRRNVILVHGVDEQFQADLADVSMLAQWNGGVHFLLTCVDVFSKYAWVVPMKNKSAETTRTAFELIFKERKPRFLMTDSGREFENHIIYQYMKQMDVHHFFAWNPDIKASIAERFNRTLKGRMWKYLTYKNTKRYIDVLPDIVHSYNNTYHRSVKMTPTEASDPSRTKEVWNNLYARRVKPGAKSVTFKYKLGDYVRISEERDVFRKGYKQGWSREVYKVVKQSPRDPVVYKLEDLSGEPLIGSFYEPELQKVSEPQVWEVEEIFRTRRTDKRGLEYFVKFKGYPDYGNRWISAVDTTVTANNK
jgi:hypothetical protein